MQQDLIELSNADPISPLAELIKLREEIRTSLNRSNLFYSDLGNLTNIPLELRPQISRLKDFYEDVLNAYPDLKTHFLRTANGQLDLIIVIDRYSQSEGAFPVFAMEWLKERPLRAIATESINIRLSEEDEENEMVVSSVQPMKTQLREHNNTLLNSALQKLPRFQKEIIEHRLGLNGHSSKSYKEIKNILVVYNNTDLRAVYKSAVNKLHDTPEVKEILRNIEGEALSYSLAEAEKITAQINKPIDIEEDQELESEVQVANENLKKIIVNNLQEIFEREDFPQWYEAFTRKKHEKAAQAGVLFLKTNKTLQEIGEYLGTQDVAEILRSNISGRRDLSGNLVRTATQGNDENALKDREAIRKYISNLYARDLGLEIIVKTQNSNFSANNVALATENKPLINFNISIDVKTIVNSEEFSKWLEGKFKSEDRKAALAVQMLLKTEKSLAEIQQETAISDSMRPLMYRALAETLNVPEALVSKQGAHKYKDTERDKIRSFLSRQFLEEPVIVLEASLRAVPQTLSSDVKPTANKISPTFAQKTNALGISQETYDVLTSKSFKRWFFKNFRSSKSKTAKAAYAVLTTNISLTHLSGDSGLGNALPGALRKAFSVNLGLPDNLVAQGKTSYYDGDRPAIRKFLCAQFLQIQENRLKRQRPKNESSPTQEVLVVPAVTPEVKSSGSKRAIDPVLTTEEFKKWFYQQFKSNGQKAANAAYLVVTTNKKLSTIRPNSGLGYNLPIALRKAFAGTLSVPENLVAQGKTSYNDNNRYAVRAHLLKQYTHALEYVARPKKASNGPIRTEVLSRDEERELFGKIEYIRRQACEEANISDFHYSDIGEIIRNPVNKQTKEKKFSKETVEKAAQLKSLYKTAIKHNMGLVYSVANKRGTNKSLDRDDYVQAGTLGLIRAIDLFSTEYDTKFSTFAIPHIKAKINRLNFDNAKTVRVPVHRQEKLNRIRKVEMQFLQEGIFMPTDEQLAEKVRLDVEQIRKLKKYDRSEQLFSMVNKSDSKKDELNLDTILADKKAKKPLDIAADAERQNNMLGKTKELMKDLTKAEIFILTHRFGLRGNKPKTHEQISKIYGRINPSKKPTTKARIEQVEKRAFDKIFKKQMGKSQFKLWFMRQFDKDNLARFAYGFLTSDLKIKDLGKTYKIKSPHKVMLSIMHDQLDILKDLDAFHQNDEFSIIKRRNIRKALFGRFIVENDISIEDILQNDIKISFDKKNENVPVTLAENVESNTPAAITNQEIKISSEESQVLNIETPNSNQQSISLLDTVQSLIVEEKVLPKENILNSVEQEKTSIHLSESLPSMNLNAFNDIAATYEQFKNKNASKFYLDQELIGLIIPININDPNEEQADFLELAEFYASEQEEEINTYSAANFTEACTHYKNNQHRSIVSYIDIFPSSDETINSSKLNARFLYISPALAMRLNKENELGIPLSDEDDQEFDRCVMNAIQQQNRSIKENNSAVVEITEVESIEVSSGNQPKDLAIQIISDSSNAEMDDENDVNEKDIVLSAELFLQNNDQRPNQTSGIIQHGPLANGKRTWDDVRDRLRRGKVKGVSERSLSKFLNARDIGKEINFYKTAITKDEIIDSIYETLKETGVLIDRYNTNLLQHGSLSGKISPAGIDRRLRRGRVENCAPMALGQFIEIEGISQDNLAAYEAKKIHAKNKLKEEKPQSNAEPKQTAIRLQIFTGWPEERQRYFANQTFLQLDYHGAMLGFLIPFELEGRNQEDLINLVKHYVENAKIDIQDYSANQLLKLFRSSLQEREKAFVANVNVMHALHEGKNPEPKERYLFLSPSMALEIHHHLESNEYADVGFSLNQNTIEKIGLLIPDSTLAKTIQNAEKPLAEEKKSSKTTEANIIESKPEVIEVLQNDSPTQQTEAEKVRDELSTIYNEENVVSAAWDTLNNKGYRPTAQAKGKVKYGCLGFTNWYYIDALISLKRYGFKDCKYNNLNELLDAHQIPLIKELNIPNGGNVSQGNQKNRKLSGNSSHFSKAKQSNRITEKSIIESVLAVLENTGRRVTPKDRAKFTAGPLKGKVSPRSLEKRFIKGKSGIFKTCPENSLSQFLNAFGIPRSGPKGKKYDIAEFSKRLDKPKDPHELLTEENVVASAIATLNVKGKRPTNHDTGKIEHGPLAYITGWVYIDILIREKKHGFKNCKYSTLSELLNAHNIPLKKELEIQINDEVLPPEDKKPNLLEEISQPPRTVISATKNDFNLKSPVFVRAIILTEKFYGWFFSHFAKKDLIAMLAYRAISTDQTLQGIAENLHAVPLCIRRLDDYFLEKLKVPADILFDNDTGEKPRKRAFKDKKTEVCKFLAQKFIQETKFDASPDNVHSSTETVLVSKNQSISDDVLQEISLEQFLGNFLACFQEAATKMNDLNGNKVVITSEPKTRDSILKEASWVPSHIQEVVFTEQDIQQRKRILAEAFSHVTDKVIWVRDANTKPERQVVMTGRTDIVQPLFHLN